MFQLRDRIREIHRHIRLPELLHDVLRLFDGGLRSIELSGPELLNR